MQRIQYQIFLKSILANYDDDNVSRTGHHGYARMLTCCSRVTTLSHEDLHNLQKLIA